MQFFKLKKCKDIKMSAKKQLYISVDSGKRKEGGTMMAISLLLILLILAGAIVYGAGLIKNTQPYHITLL
jgi:hypothetical protein